MSGTKVAPTLWAVALDLHIGITVPHDLHLIALLSQNSKFLVLAGRSFLLVSEAQTAAIGSLEDRQGSLVSDLKERIGTLSATSAPQKIA